MSVYVRGRADVGKVCCLLYFLLHDAFFWVLHITTDCTYEKLYLHPHWTHHNSDSQIFGTFRVISNPDSLYFAKHATGTGTGTFTTAR